MPVTRAEELDALAERVEKLTGVDREVDARIHFAFNPDQRIMTDSGSMQPPKRDASYCLLHEFNLDTWEDWDGLSIIVGAKPVTSSLDAAMSLVPEGLSWTLGQNVHHGYWQASINKLDDDGVPTSVGCSNATKMPYSALTCAALRAQASIIREAGR